jgi:protein TonB
LIEKRLAYPALARRRGIQGRVDLVLQIGKEGQLLSGSLSQSSGSDILDRAAGKALAGVFPLEGMRMDRVEVVRVSIDYRLP